MPLATFNSWCSLRLVSWRLLIPDEGTPAARRHETGGANILGKHPRPGPKLRWRRRGGVRVDLRQESMSTCRSLDGAPPPARPPATRICIHAKFAADTFLISLLRMSRPREWLNLAIISAANMIIGGAQSSAVIGCAGRRWDALVLPAE